jgi:hypothetical protein
MGQENLQDFVEKPSVDVQQSVLKSGDPGASDDRDDLYYDKDGVGIANQVDDTIDINFVEEIREKNEPGFQFLDRAIKNYFSGIRIPVKNGEEGHRIMGVKITGGQSATLIYATDDFRGGKLKLPIMAISRTNESYDNKRYSPPDIPVHRTYHNNGRRVELIYRPVPYLIDYVLDIWTEHKSDAEYAEYSILSRFNPVASFFLSDTNGMSMEVICSYGGSSDNSENETDESTHGRVFRSISIQVEGWLPLPTKIVPTVLSNPVIVKESVVGGGGETFFSIRDKF